jgi:tetratricopeptide (TPR) repeat protein
VSAALLVSHYRELPELRTSDDPDLWAARMHDSLRTFRIRVNKSYTEGTLQRLLSHNDRTTRQAAVLSLGIMGSMQSNAILASKLHDPEERVARMAADALWQIWFRGGNEEQNSALQRIVHLPDFLEILAGLDDLIAEAPEFAEAYNQRAILFFNRGEFRRSAADCERVIELNPYHFGAQAGLGQCYLKLRRPRAAIRAFRLAIQTNPTLTHLADTIASLERTMGG